MNTWDADAASCSAPQDAYDTEKESTVCFNMDVKKLEDFTVGTYRDVYCVKNKIYYEAVIMKVKPGKKQGDPDQVLYHFKGWKHSFDEWIPADSERVQPHNLYTNPFAENVREQEKWQGVTGITTRVTSAFKQEPKRRSSGGGTSSETKPGKRRKSGEMVAVVSEEFTAGVQENME